MLTGIRKATQGWIAGGLLTLIAAAFVVWGIPHDIFTAAPKDAVASGSGVQVSPGEYRTAFDRAIEQLRQQNPGRPIDVQTAVENGVDKVVLQQMVGEEALNHLADTQGFAASDAIIARAIREDPAFRNQLTGAFDKQTYESLLARNNLTPDRYEMDLRNQLKRRQIALASAAGVRAPKSLVNLLYAFETERRVVSVAAITPARLGPPPEPTEKDLQDFYQRNAQRLATPEYRKVTLVLARPEAFVATASVPEEEIRKLYEFQKPKLGSAEKRSFVQISAPTKEAASEAARRLAAGEAAQKVAAALNLQTITFNQLVKEGIPDPAIADAVFALKAGQTTNAIKGRLAWAAARVSEITPASIPSYESMREKLRAEKLRDAGADALNAAVSKFDDERAAGKSLEEAASVAGLALVTRDRVDAQGGDGQGAPVAGLADDPALLKTIFQTEANETTDFTPTPDGGFVLARVDQVIPKGVRPFADVKPMLTLALKAEQTGDAMRKIAESIAADVKAGKSFAQAAKAHAVPIAAASQSMDRRQAMGPTAPQLGGAIFSAAEGAVVSAPDARGGALLVAHVERIERSDPGANPELLAKAQQAADRMIVTDLLTTVQAAAVRAAKVKTNPKLLRQTIGLPEPEDDADKDAPKS